MSNEPLLIDEYQLLNPIATGNFTTVWEVVEKGGGTKHYAMKLLLPESAAESEQRSVLKHEAKIAERLQHPNLVAFHKLVMSKNRGYIVMDYFRSLNLKSQFNADFVSVQVRFVRLAEQLCQVVAYIHDQGFLHRDIKPDNILFNKGSELRLIDFSLSTRIAGAVAKMLTTKRGKMIQGTRTYIAPETIKKEVPTPQTDIYSLGVTFFEILTGEPPFKGSTPGELLKKHVGTTPPEPSLLNRNLTPELDRMILRMLAKKPKDRQRSVHEVFSELRALKVFKEDMQEVANRRTKELADKHLLSLDKSGRLDSRADAVRVQMMRDDPEFAKLDAEKKQKRAMEQKKKEQEAAERARRAAAKSDDSSPEEGAATRPRSGSPPRSAPAPAPAAPYPSSAPAAGMPMPYPPMGYPAPYGAPQYGMPPGAGYAAPPPYAMPPYGTPMYGAPPYGGFPQGMPYGAPPGVAPPQPAPGGLYGIQPGQAMPPAPGQPAAPRSAPPPPGAPQMIPGQPGGYWQELPPLTNAPVPPAPGRSAPVPPAPVQPNRPQQQGAPRPPAPPTPNAGTLPPKMDQLPPVQ